MSNHRVVILTAPGNDDEVRRITLKVKDGLLVSWNLKDELCWLSKTMDLELRQYLPYFEPDLSDYQKLINKVKIYILFS